MIFGLRLPDRKSQTYSALPVCTHLLVETNHQVHPSIIGVVALIVSNLQSYQGTHMKGITWLIFTVI